MILGVALRKELLEQWRTHRLLVLAVVFVLMGLISPLLAKLTPELLRLIPGGDQFVPLIPPPTAADAVAQYVKNISQFGIILALLLAMGAVAGEKDRGTAALMLAKPFPRGAFLLAKFGALALTFLVSLIVAGIVGYYYTLLLFTALPPGGWLALNALVWLWLLVYLALTLFCSTITRSQAAAGGLAFGFLVILSLLGSLPRVGEYLPGQLLNWGSALALGSTRSAWPAVAVSVGLIALSLLAAWLLFRRQEL